MRFYISTQSIEKDLQLVSIAVVSQDGRFIHAISSDFNPEDATPAVQEKVLAQLDPETPRLSHDELGFRVYQFIDPLNSEPEVWGADCALDWLQLKLLIGNLEMQPAGMPMFCRELHQLVENKVRYSKYPISLPELPEGCHNVLAQASWIRDCVEKLDPKAFMTIYNPIRAS